MVKSLISAADQGQLPHALLFWGPLSQPEKTDLILELAHHLQGLKRKLSKKQYVTSSMSDMLPDFKLLTPDKEKDRDTISVDQIERLDEELALYPFESVNRIVYIPNASAMTVPAQNSLLKKLEEPPANNYIILDVAKPRILLRTIVSRCLPIYLPKAPNERGLQFEDYLPDISNPDEAQKLLLSIEQLFACPDAKGVALISDIKEILAERTPLSDEEKLLICAFALKERYPTVAQNALLLSDNPQKISLDSFYYYISQDMVH